MLTQKKMGIGCIQNSLCELLCELLRQEIKTRFNYELNSEIYQVNSVNKTNNIVII
jgi:hypothetical protein